jgi:hypothetical protein
MAAELHIFLLAADKLVRCRWNGRSERVDIANSALEGETLREVAQDPFKPNRLYAATLTEIHVSEDAGATWSWVPSGGDDLRLCAPSARSGHDLRRLHRWFHLRKQRRR